MDTRIGKGKKRIALIVCGILILVLLVGLGIAHVWRIVSREKVQQGCLIQEDEKHIYVCSAYRVAKVDKQTKEMQILWENEEMVQERKELLYVNGSGLLIGDTIYFVEGIPKDTPELEERRALSCVKTDGSDYRRLDELTTEYRSVYETWFPSLKYVEGIIYVKNADMPKLYRVDSHGDYQGLSDEWVTEEEKEIPAGYGHMSYFWNGERRLEAAESKAFWDCYFVSGGWANGQWMKYKDGEEKELIEDKMDTVWEMMAYNESYLLFSGKDMHWLYLWDCQKEEFKELVKIPRVEPHDKRYEIVCMDEEAVYLSEPPYYWGREDSSSPTVVYHKIDLETGEMTKLCTIPIGSQKREALVYGYYDQVITGGYLYYVGQQGSAFYLMRRNLEEPDKEEILGDAFYDAGFDMVGKKITEQVRTSGHDPIFGTVQVDDRFLGASKINHTMQEYMEELHESADFSNSVDEVSYYDGAYVSFLQHEWSLRPEQEGFTFDLETGERLQLEDVIAENNVELKNIVMEVAREWIAECPESFEDDAEKMIRRNIFTDTAFYLGMDGIHFCVESPLVMPQYGGFEIVVPYEKFTMKIPVGQNGAEQEASDQNVTEQNVTGSEEEGGETMPLDIEPWSGNLWSDFLLEDEENLYFCREYKVLKINKETKESVTLWKEDKNEENKRDYSNVNLGSGLLVGDYLYFIEADRRLSMIRTDGSGYKRVQPPDGFNTEDLHYDAKMMIRDGILYTYVVWDLGFGEREEKVFFYQVDKNGTIWNATEQKGKQSEIPEEYWEANDLWGGQSKEMFGYYLLERYTNPEAPEEDNWNCEWIQYIPGEEPVVIGEEAFYGYNDTELLFLNWWEEVTEEAAEYHYEFDLMDRTTLESRRLNLVVPYTIDVLGMDNHFIYYHVAEYDPSHYLSYCGCSDVPNAFSYWRVSLETGEKEQMFAEFPGPVAEGTIEYYMYPTVRNNYLYYIGERDYAIYLIRRNLDTPQTEELMGEPIEDTLVSKVGEWETYEETYYDEKNPEREIGKLEIRFLKVDDTFPGAEKINQFFSEYQEQKISILKEKLSKIPEDEEERAQFYASSYSKAEELNYFDGRYFSFIQWEDFSRELSWIFDLETGEKLELKDLVAESEEEVEEMVLWYAQAIVDASSDKEKFVKNIPSMVEEGVDADAAPILEEDGFHFIIDCIRMNAYDYETTELVIPYEEFTLKIPLWSEESVVPTEQ